VYLYLLYFLPLRNTSPVNSLPTHTQHVTVDFFENAYIINQIYVVICTVMSLLLTFSLFLDLFESLEDYIPGLHVQMKHVSLFWHAVCKTSWWRLWPVGFIKLCLLFIYVPIACCHSNWSPYNDLWYRKIWRPAAINVEGVYYCLAVVHYCWRFMRRVGSESQL